MVMSEREAKERYQDGIDSVGISAYRNAADATSISEAAETLEQAAQDNLDSSEMANKWANRY